MITRVISLQIYKQLSVKTNFISKIIRFLYQKKNTTAFFSSKSQYYLSKIEKFTSLFFRFFEDNFVKLKNH